MLNIHEKIKIAAKAKGLNFEKLEFKLFGKRTGNLSKSLKQNQMVSLLEKIFEVLDLDIVSRKEMIRLRALEAKLKDLTYPD